MSQHFKAIPVTDRNGDQLIVYEMVRRTGPLGLIPKKRIALCTGEPVELLEDGSFIVIGTGERLLRA